MADNEPPGLAFLDPWNIVGRIHTLLHIKHQNLGPVVSEKKIFIPSYCKSMEINDPLCVANLDQRI